ncbi:MAG: hypothetical protein HXS44_07645 [Theionarchaea archaeon]|nr:hypothetical protein [Theionarchaea archaeon]
MKITQLLAFGIVFILSGCIVQQGNDFEAAVSLEPLVSEGDIITVINKWNHELVESFDSDYLSSWMLASLIDPVVYDIIENLNVEGKDPLRAAVTFRQWALRNEAHTQGLPQFFYVPGRDPWGAVSMPYGNSSPIYKKLLPSEMKAMSIFSGKITGKCMTLANLNVCLFRLMGVEPDNAVVIRTESHGVGLVKFGGRVYFLNNNDIQEVNDEARQWITTQTFAGLWTESISIDKEFTINDDVFRSPDSILCAIWKANWGKEPPSHASLLPDNITRDAALSAIFGKSNAENGLAILTKYAYQSLYVKKPELYLLASLRAPKAKELARRLDSPEDIITWIKARVASISIFADEDRIMVADQVIVFETGGPKDQALLAFTLLKLKGYQPVLTITTESAYIEYDGRIYDAQTWESVDTIWGKVILVLDLTPENSYFLFAVTTFFQMI